MRYLVPHALILVAFAAWAGGRLPETVCLIALVGGHLVIPVWAAAVAPRGVRARAILLGPGIAITIHAIAITVLWRS